MSHKNRLLLLLFLCTCSLPVFAQQQPEQPPAGQVYHIDQYTFSLFGELNGFDLHFSSRFEGKDILYLTLNLKAKQKIKVKPLALRWHIPATDIQGCWSPGRNFNKYVNPSWKENSFISRSTTNAPVVTLFNNDSENRFTFAGSDAMNSLKISSGLNESTSMLDCEVQLFAEPGPDLDSYQLSLRMDRRKVHYWESLSAVSAWWENMPVYKANLSPEAAKLPMYSTWYSFHQKLDTREVELQCKLAKAMGCESVIVDDGWQTLDSNLGYAYSGDWNPERIPQMKNHVERVHGLGMKFILWYSVPFIGEKSKIYTQFQGKYLYYKKRWGAYVLDPRFPEVRRYLIDKYVTALKEWDLDGFKLDFVDSFVAEDENTVQTASGGRDYASINEALDILLTDVMRSLKTIKPDVMIEFRQSYIGPLMRKYGNMFRAGDVPNDALSNRVRTTDLRLLSGKTAVHSDMLSWNVDEKPEIAAFQLLNILFSVPQISVKLDQIPVAHQQMLNFWLGFWRKHQDVILTGNFKPENPELNYPLITASNYAKQLTVLFAPQAIIRINEKMKDSTMIVNATHHPAVVLSLKQAAGEKVIKIYNCLGKLQLQKRIKLAAGLHEFTVPVSGLIQIQ